jgi:hypothetical protein
MNAKRQFLCPQGSNDRLANHTGLLVEDMEMVKIHERKEMSTALRPGFRCSYPASTIKIPEMPIIDNLKACICPFGRVSMLCVEMECGAGLGDGSSRAWVDKRECQGQRFDKVEQNFHHTIQV